MTPRPHVRPMAFQEGQALVLGILLAGLATLALVRYFSTGQMVAAKARQLHVVDATAYSGAIIQARALNMLALINRAHVGHQLAMAHLVTLGSWAALGETEGEQVSVGNPPAHIIAMFFGAEHGAAYLAARKASGLAQRASTHGDLANAYAQHDTVVHGLLTGVQNQVVNQLPTARRLAMEAVLGQNYPGDASTLTLTDDMWPGYLQSSAATPNLGPFIKDMARMYAFLSPRDHTEKNQWSVDARCPSLRHELRRRGRTELDPNGRWQSIDTQSYHALRSNRWIGCYYREYSMGWGWIPASSSQRLGDIHVDNPPEDFAAQDFWRWVKEATNWDIAGGTENPLANSKASVDRQRWSGGGLAPYFDVKKGNGDVPLGFSVKLQRAAPQGQIITTTSAAQTYFVRPQARVDGRIEAANLFHPYWQARLAPSGNSVTFLRRLYE